MLWLFGIDELWVARTGNTVKPILGAKIMKMDLRIGSHKAEPTLPRMFCCGDVVHQLRLQRLLWVAVQELKLSYQNMDR